MIRDMFYVNNELSQGRVFLAIAFLVAICGIFGMWIKWIEVKAEYIDLIKWILGFVFGNKTADAILGQVFGSARGENPGPKNPQGGLPS